MIKKYKSIALIIIASSIVTSILVVSSVKISKQYFTTHTFFYDPVMTHSRTFPFYERMQAEADLNPIASRINFAVLWFKADSRSVFLYVPTILCVPKLMATPWASMPSVAFMFFCFLVVLGISLHMRKQPLYIIFGVLLFFASAPFLTNPEYGLAAGWHDLPASFFLASGILSFLNWRHTNNLKWIIASGIFLSLATMSRSHFIVFSGFIFIVPIIITFIERYKNLNKSIVPSLLFGGTIILLITPFFYFHFAENFSYYYQNPMPTGVAENRFASFQHFLHMIPRTGTYFSVLLMILGITIIAFSPKQSISNKIIGLWIMFILPFLWVVILHAGNTYHVYIMQYSIAFLIFLIIPHIQSNKISYLVCAFICLFSITSFAIGYSKNLKFAHNPTQEAKEYKHINTILAKYIKNLKSNETWNPYFEDDYARIANCETFYHYGIYPQKYSSTILYRSQLFWKAIYKGMNDSIIVDTYIKDLQKLSFIVINKKITELNFNSYSNSHTTNAVLQSIHKSVCASNNWKEIETIKTKKFGELAILIKRK